jgi:putative DNA methylase
LFNPEKLPGLHDPFAGGGTIPLEAQRLGLDAYASDLNPVAVLINKAMIEIPPRFARRPPINPVWQRVSAGEKLLRQWQGAQGLAEDVRYYAQWMRDEAEKRIGHLYPNVEITADMASKRPDLKPLVGRKLTVIAWLWARTVKSPNPAYRHIDVPLASTFILSSKEGKEAYVLPLIDGDRYSFQVKLGKPPTEAKEGTRIARGSFKCLLSNTPFTYGYIDDEANAGRMNSRLMAIVAEGDHGRVYLEPTKLMEAIPKKATPVWKPDTPCRGTWASNAQGRIYGFKTFGDYFTPRQLVALTTFSDLVTEAREKIHQNALAASIPDDENRLDAGGTGATAYADAVAVYLSFAVSKAADRNTSLCFWEYPMDRLRGTFGRQALPMIWDYAETNPFAGAGGDIYGTAHSLCEVLDKLPIVGSGTAVQADAAVQSISAGKAISTDPPYYDNVAYADLSDFFYVWLRRTMKPVFPELFATLVTPKTEELIAAPYRHGSKEKAEAFFLAGMARAMHCLAEKAHPAIPVTIYYAFKQSETQTEKGTTSTGWETFLEAVNRAGLAVTGTWPMRTEQSVGLKGNINSLASCIVLVCRQRSANAPTISRRAFQRELNRVLPEALDEMTRGSGGDHSSVAPVDLSQAIIGPGMGVFSKYATVLEADGSPMNVKTALSLINRFLAEDDFDHDTQFCLHWFEQYGWKDGKFGDADTLARAKGTSVEGVKQAGVLSATGGVVRLLKWAEYNADWDAGSDVRLPVWEALHHLIRVFKTEGESGAGAVLTAVQAKAEATRQLAYRLYTLCERAGWAEDARPYNEIITSWSAIESAATRVPGPKQGALYEV